MELNKRQLDRLSGFLTDLAKILFASSVVGFFIPGPVGQVSVFAFIWGFLSASTCLILGLKLLQKPKLNL